LQRLRASSPVTAANGRGIWALPVKPAEIIPDVAENVVRISENWSCSDRIQVRHSVDITLYNPNGIYDRLMTKAYGVRVYLGWGDPDHVFTGVSYGGRKSEQAGRETVTITCQDYMSILEATRMLNSPYYDGMDAYDAIADLASRARISTVDDTGSGNIQTMSGSSFSSFSSSSGTRYYLPAGYSWTQPKIRFNTQSGLLENMVSVCKLCEKVIYFDETGVFHFSNLQGGLFSNFSGHQYEFRRSPFGNNYHVILEKKEVECKLSSSINRVYLRTVDRTRGTVYVTQRIDKRGRFPFDKPLMIDSPMLGSVPAANTYAAQLIANLSRVPREISFQTIMEPGEVIMPMQIIKVDEELMRVKSVSREFNADDNSLTCSVSCEWWSHDF
jgi:hypothetical protein